MLVKRPEVLSIIMLFCILISHCSTADTKSKKQSAVKMIQSGQELESILDNSKDELLMFDLYADWCMPCRMLSPLLETIAQEQRDKVTIYKINVDKHPDIAGAFGVSGIPFVVFVKNKVGVHALTGVQPKETYIRAINQFTTNEKAPDDVTPNGTLIDGKRVIHLSTSTAPGDIYVYRGETVSIILDTIHFPYSIAIPAFNILQKGAVGKRLEVTFKARDIGVFPIFCNGKCPSGDGARYGQIVVMQYKTSGKASFTEQSAKEAAALIKSKNPFILDVRTPNEYYSGHLKNAQLIPLQQLEARINELAAYKDKDILVYCRSGNRSTVAAQILINHGFKKLYNLRPGIIGWKAAGEEIVKE